MIKIKVTEQDKQLAKQQIERFEKIPEGNWRYSGVAAWRGVVCQNLAGKWLYSWAINQNFKVHKKEVALDDSGVVDGWDMIINAKKVEIKSATKNYYTKLMPKTYDVRDKPKDIYIGCKYNETVEPNEMYILGYIAHSEILKFDTNKNKGARYYEVPLSKLLPIEQIIDYFRNTA